MKPVWIPFRGITGPMLADDEPALDGNGNQRPYVHNTGEVILRLLFNDAFSGHAAGKLARSIEAKVEYAQKAWGERIAPALEEQERGRKMTGSDLERWASRWQERFNASVIGEPLELTPAEAKLLSTAVDSCGKVEAYPVAEDRRFGPYVSRLYGPLLDDIRDALPTRPEVPEIPPPYESVAEALPPALASPTNGASAQA